MRLLPPVPRMTRRAAAAACVALVLLGTAACSGEEPTGTATPTAPPARSTPTGSTSGAPSGSGTTSGSPSATASVKPSTNTNKIKVSGDFGDSPKLTFDAPFAIDKTQTRVLEPGSGIVVKSGSIEISYYGVNARTGKKFDESYSRKQTVAFSLDGVIPGFSKGLTGQKVGSRVLIAITGPDGYDSSGGNAEAGINLGDTLLFVVDIVSAQLPGPTGKKVTPPDGLPTVAESDGVPAITVPKTDAPTKLVVQPLVQGTGRKVAATDQVVTDYRAVSWADGSKVFDTYGGEPETSLVNATIPGLTEALVGQKVGTRVLVVVPPAQGYPEGNATPKVDKGVTLVFVVDILFASAPS